MQLRRLRICVSRLLMNGNITDMLHLVEDDDAIRVYAADALLAGQISAPGLVLGVHDVE